MSKTQKFPEAEGRLFTRVFVCRQCNSKIRADSLKVRSGQVKCRKCNSTKLRPKHKDLKGA
ncbi:MAG TPA: 50S ribosomal protein L40e [archaeon]|nr:50S ribosomal protein L40e [archaeon]